jgi:hypothetical protein
MTPTWHETSAPSRSSWLAIRDRDLILTSRWGQTAEDPITPPRTNNDIDFLINRTLPYAPAAESPRTSFNMAPDDAQAGRH